jgi:hypothetical protein
VKGFLAGLFISYGDGCLKENHLDISLEELMFGDHGCWYGNYGPIVALRQSGKRYLILAPLFGRTEKVMLTTDNIEEFVHGISQIPKKIVLKNGEMLHQSMWNDFEYLDRDTLSASEIKTYFLRTRFKNQGLKLPTLDFVPPIDPTSNMKVKVEIC